MAAGGFINSFGSDLPLKRKRHLDNDDENPENNNVFSSFKRRNISHLPIRSPPRPSISILPAFGRFPLNPGTLTPDSIPEDDVFRSNPELDKHQDTIRPFRQSNTSSTESIATQAGSETAIDDTEMDLSSPKQASRLQQAQTPIRIGRARSNDLMSPVRSPIVIPPSPSRGWAQDRIPTPVASRFPVHSPFESSFASAAARQMRPHLLSTSLSPMVDAESWTPQIQRPPSPGPECDLELAFGGGVRGDPDETMEMDETNSNMMSSSFSGLSVHSSDMHSTFPHMGNHLRSSPSIRIGSGQQNNTIYDNSNSHQGLGLGNESNCDRDYAEGVNMTNQPDQARNNTSQSGIYGHVRNQSSGTGARTARLHMGFRADCEKCVARVPGHYSHIIWS